MRPIAANPQFPLAAPDQLKAGLDRLASFVEAEGRSVAEFDIVYRVHHYDLRQASEADRQPFVGTAADIAEDIRQFEALGVTHLVIDFTSGSHDLSDVLTHMEAFATQVWPLLD